MVVQISETMGGTTILFGTAQGKKCFERLLALTSEPSQAEILFLDFGTVESATVSFLREGPLAFRKYLRERSSNIYPVFANLAEPVLDSLSEFLATKKDAVFCCALDASGNQSNPLLIGTLEDKQMIAFTAVNERGTTSAIGLVRERVDPPTNATAWNNRLAALVGKGLLVESRVGRTKAFRVTLPGAVSAWA